MALWENCSESMGIGLSYLEHLSYDTDSLLLLIDNNGIQGKITFKECLSFRFINEDCAFEILSEHHLDGKAWFFVSKNTEFSQWFDFQSSNVYHGEYYHYRMIFFNHIIDILSARNPLLVIDRCE